MLQIKRHFIHWQGAPGLSPTWSCWGCTHRSRSTHPQTGRGRALRGAARRWTRWAPAQAEGARERAGTPGRSALPRGPVAWSCALLRPAESAWEYLAREGEQVRMLWQEKRGGREMGKSAVVVRVISDNYRLSYWDFLGCEDVLGPFSPLFPL